MPRLTGIPLSGKTHITKMSRVEQVTLGAWNVRTLLDREGTSRPERRRVLIDSEVDRYNVHIAALSETRIADVGEEHDLLFEDDCAMCAPSQVAMQHKACKSPSAFLRRRLCFNLHRMNHM